jgi:hypothetical protein
MVTFYNAAPVLADKIAGAIVEMTMQRMDAENRALEDAEKNSETTPTPASSGDGVVNTDSIPEQQESAG